MTGYPEPPTLPEWLHLVIVLCLIALAIGAGWSFFP